VSADLDPIDVALRVTAALDALGVDHTIGGSIASSVAGEPRSTIDIDVVAALTESHIGRLMEALADEFYLDETALTRAVRERSAANKVARSPTGNGVTSLALCGCRALAWIGRTSPRRRRCLA